MKLWFLLPVLLLSTLMRSHAFTLDIANDQVADFGRGPSSIFLPGYGEVVFESGMDGVLVLDSAYASTSGIEVSPALGESSSEPSVDGAPDSTDSDFIAIGNRRTRDMSFPLQLTVHATDLQNPAGGWNAVPEAASAALGLVGTLMLLLRRRVRTISPA